MARNKELAEREYKDIREAYQKMKDVKEFGVQKYTNEYITRKVAHKFYKTPITVENIIYHRV